GELVLHAHAFQRGVAAIGELRRLAAAIVVNLAVAREARAVEDDVEGHTQVVLEWHDVQLLGAQIDARDKRHGLKLASDDEAAPVDGAFELEIARLAEVVAEI